jgi:hypothetical protein
VLQLLPARDRIDKVAEAMAAPDSLVSSEMTLPSDILDTAQGLLQYLRIISPIALLLAFVIAFIVSSISSARQLTPTTTPACGPGGRPLPKRTRSTMAIMKNQQNVSPRFRIVFQWLSLAVLLTFLVDATVNVSHAIIDRSEHWWRGQATVVSKSRRTYMYCQIR